MVYIVGMEIHKPGTAYTTSELNNILGDEIHSVSEKLGKIGNKRTLVDIIFSEAFEANLGINNRYLLVPPNDNVAWLTNNNGKTPIANEGVTLYSKLMEKYPSQSLGKDDKLIVISNIFDGMLPNLAVSIATSLGLDQSLVRVAGISNSGCSAFITGLRDADDYLKAYPDAKVVLLVDEVTSPCFHHPFLANAMMELYNNASETEKEVLARGIRGLYIQKYLFGDGCVAALCVANPSNYNKSMQFNTFHAITNLDSEDLTMLEQVGFGTTKYILPGYGFFWQDFPRLTERLKKAYLPTALKIIQSEEINIGDKQLAIHAGSRRLINLVRDECIFNDNMIEPSRLVLNEYGNMNSATGPYVLNQLYGSTNAGEEVTCMFFGVGFTLQLAYNTQRAQK